MKSDCSNDKDRNVICRLYDTYSPALSERQRDILDLYYNDDLSLSEIAENLGITRQGVRDAARHGEEYLKFLESSLGIVSREKKVREIANEIISATDDAKIKSLAEKLLDI